jgi:hypothetical protein
MRGSLNQRWPNSPTNQAIANASGQAMSPMTGTAIFIIDRSPPRRERSG